MSASRGLPAASGGQAAARGGPPPPPPPGALRRSRACQSLAARLPAAVRGHTAVVLSRPAGGHLLRQPQEANTPPFLLPSTPAAPSDF